MRFLQNISFARTLKISGGSIYNSPQYAKIPYAKIYLKDKLKERQT